MNGHTIYCTRVLGMNGRTLFVPDMDTEYLLMLNQPPAAFQQLVNNVFRNILGQYVIIYLDEILTFSKNPEQHYHHVQSALGRLRKH